MTKSKEEKALRRLVDESSLNDEQQRMLQVANQNIEAAKDYARSCTGTAMLSAEHKTILSAFQGNRKSLPTPQHQDNLVKPRETFTSSTPKVEMSSTFSPKEWLTIIVVGSTICLPACIVAINLISQ